jgi:hypothetical protein
MKPTQEEEELADEEHTLPEELRQVRKTVHVTHLQIVMALVGAGKTDPVDILQTPQTQIERIAHINHEESNNLLLHVSKLIFNKKPTNIFQLLEKEKMKLAMGYITPCGSPLIV